MKNKKLVALVLVVLGFLFVKVGITWAQSVLPRITTVCETRAGTFISIDDGFSLFKTCPGGSRLVSLGEAATTGGGGTVVGDVAFFSPITGWLLKIDGTAWQSLFDGWANTYQLVADTNRNLPSGISASDVVVWDYSSFMVKNGDIYNFNYQTNNWVNVGHP